MTKIKICGLTREEDINSVNRWLPDYAGFVFCKSRRQVDPKQAGKLRKMLDERIKPVGVFVNASIEFIEKLYCEGVIDLAQLHGDESSDYISELKNRIACPVIKAVRVKSTEQILRYEKCPCDILLLDSYVEGIYGGSGKTFNHLFVPKLDKKEFFIAGGLNSENIEQAIRMLKPYGVDVSSGVESNGVKDDGKISRIIQLVRSLHVKT
jgi:phosphoribosylanthranilate isomerase